MFRLRQRDRTPAVRRIRPTLWMPEFPAAAAGRSARAVRVSPCGSTAAEGRFARGDADLFGRHVLHVPLRVDAGGRRIEDIAALHHLPNDVGVDRIGFGIVVDVHVETVHHVETRIAEQLLQRLPLERFVDLGLQECRKIGIDRQRFDRGSGSPRAGAAASVAAASRHCRRGVAIGAPISSGFAAGVSFWRAASRFSRDQRPSDRPSSGFVPSVMGDS